MISGNLNNIDALNKLRVKKIVKASLVGILINILLVIFKATIGIFTNSISVILDAVNNLTDVLSSVVTIIGTKLSEKEADKEHPLGHGRIEYLSAMIVASIILYAGITAIIESIKKIFSPSLPEYTNISLIIIAVSILVKIFLGRYIKKMGEKYESQSLIASGKDALFDAIISTTVLITAIIFINYQLSLEAYMGIIISGIIIKSGIEILMESIDDILGKRVDKNLIKNIKETICKEHNITGAYDLVLHSYGPKKYIGSVHIEIPDTMTAEEIDPLERKITDTIYKKFGVMLMGISIYSVNTKSPEILAIRSKILKIVMSHTGVLEFHAFYVDFKKKKIRFDITIDYAEKNRENIFSQVFQAVQSEYPDFEIYIKQDLDIDI